MFTEGIVKSYNIERGFGFIDIDGEKKDLFFHITDFPRAAGEPKIGERLKFLIVEEGAKFKATNIVRLDLKVSYPNASIIQNEISNHVIHQNHSPSQRKGMVFTVVGLIVIVILMGLVFLKYQSYQQAQKLKAEQLIEEQKQIVAAQRQALGDLPEVKFSEKTEQALKAMPTPPVQNDQMQLEQQSATAQAQFSCDGRTHCSQMHSYEEAVFFLRNCPNTKMDGNNDGEPCERQFGR